MGVGEEHLRLTQEDEAVLVERVVEPRQDPRLSLGGEVHERVATDQDVDPGNGRILHQIVAAEDQGAPEIRAEREARPARLEVAVGQLRRNVLQLVAEVSAGPRLGECFFVDVGQARPDASGTPQLSESAPAGGVNTRMSPREISMARRKFSSKRGPSTKPSRIGAG